MMFVVLGGLWFVGIYSGGVWFVECFVCDFGVLVFGVVNVVLYCDDYVKKGLYS